MKICFKIHPDDFDKTANEKFYEQKSIDRIHRIISASFFFLCFLNIVITDYITYNAFELIPFFQNLQYKIITMPELYIAITLLLVYAFFSCLYKHITSKKDADNNSGRKIQLISGIIVICVSAIFVILSLFSLLTAKTADIPAISDGKYLDIHDFGIEDKITGTGLKHSGKELPNRITVRKTLTAELTLTNEYYHIGDKSFIVYQDIIEYRNQETAMKAACLLINDKYNSFTETSADGFEAVYTTSEDIVAVTGNTVYRLTVITGEDSLVPDTEHLLRCILDKQ